MKKTVKLFILFIIALSCAVLLIACGGNNGGNNGGGNEDVPSVFAGITFSNATYTYDGTEKEIVVADTLPDGVTVEYENNKGTTAGTYNARAILSCDGYDSITLTAKLTIGKATYDMSNASWNYNSPFTYDGIEKSVAVNGLPDGVTVESYINNVKTGAGDYTANVTLSYDKTNYNAVSIPALNWKIEKASFDLTGVSWNYESGFTYDGTEREIVLNGTIPQGLTVNYSGNKATNAGNYTAKANFICDTANYNKPVIADLSWKIDKANLSLAFNDVTVEYDTQVHSIYVTGTIPATATVVYKYDGVVAEGVSEVGEYEVTVTVTDVNYNTAIKTATLKIKSTEEELFSARINGKTYFQNSLDSKRLYVVNGTNPKMINKDVPKYITVKGNSIIYVSTGLLSSTVNEYDGTATSTLFTIKDAKSLTTDGNAYYYSVNNLLLNTDKNGIYKATVENNELITTRLVSDKSDCITYCNGNIYYSNLSDGGKLYSVSANAVDGAGTLLWEEKVSDIINDDNTLFFNSSKTVISFGVASAIYRYNVLTHAAVKLTSDAGKYLTKIGNYIYYINNDKLTTLFFGDGIYRASALSTEDNNAPGQNIIKAEDGNGYSSLSGEEGMLYYYKLNDKHFYSYNISNAVETDLMKDFVPVDDSTATGYAKIAEHNGELYYIDQLDRGNLYKINLTTKAKVKVIADCVSGFYFNGNDLYYSTYVISNYALFRCNLTTGETDKINTGRCDNLIFDNDKIYYVKIGVTKNSICVMDLDGQNSTELYSAKNPGCEYFQKIGDDLYFIMNPSVGYQYLYKYSITGNTATQLNKSQHAAYVYDNKLYYNDDAKGLCRSDLDGSNVGTVIAGVKINDFVIYDGYIYYSNTVSGAVGLYKLAIGTNNPIKISDKPADALTVVNGKIYFSQTAISYTKDYPSNSGGDGHIYCYNGLACEKIA